MQHRKSTRPARNICVLIYLLYSQYTCIVRCWDEQGYFRAHVTNREWKCHWLLFFSLHQLDFYELHHWSSLNVINMSAKSSGISLINNDCFIVVAHLRETNDNCASSAIFLFLKNYMYNHQSHCSNRIEIIKTRFFLLDLLTDDYRGWQFIRFEFRFNLAGNHHSYLITAFHLVSFLFNKNLLIE